MSAEIRLWRWYYTDQFGKRRIFPCLLSEANAKSLIDPVKVDGSLEVHRPLGHTSDLQKPSSAG